VVLQRARFIRGSFLGFGALVVNERRFRDLARDGSRRGEMGRKGMLNRDRITGDPEDFPAR
jgi:hypothetical protein